MMAWHGEDDITGPLWGESTSHWWIPLTKGPEMWNFDCLFIYSLNKLFNANGIVGDFGYHDIDGLVQERRNSSALAMELRLSCTNPVICDITVIELTHWGRDKMAFIFQTIFSNAFPWMKMFEFQLESHWSLFLKFQSIINQHRCR